MRANGSARLVLVVEDDLAIRSAIVAEFVAQGWTTVEAGSGETAVDLLTQQPVDALVTDIQLEGLMRGWDVAHAFRAARPHSPVVYTSGNTVEPSRCVDASLFFTKPFSSRELVMACGRLLRCSPQP